MIRSDGVLRMDRYDDRTEFLCRVNSLPKKYIRIARQYDHIRGTPMLGWYGVEVIYDDTGFHLQEQDGCVLFYMDTYSRKHYIDRVIYEMEKQSFFDSCIDRLNR